MDQRKTQCSFLSISTILLQDLNHYSVLRLLLSSLRRQGERLGKMAQARKQEKGAGERKWDDKSVK